MDPSLKLAMGEFRDHKGVYLAIIVIVALSMTVFTTQSSMNSYNDYVTYKSIGMFYGDGVVTTGGTTVRNIVSGASKMTDARQTVDKINAIPEFVATPKAEGEGALANDAITAWGIDLKTDENVCQVKNKLIDGTYFDTSKNYTQTGMGNPFGTRFLLSPTLAAGPVPSNATRNDQTILPYPIIIGKTCAAINNWKVGTIFTGDILTEAGVLFCSVRWEVIGIYETEKPLMETIFYVVPIESLQEIRGWDSNTANYICIDAPDGMSDAEIRELLAPAIGDKVFYSKEDIKNVWEGNLNVIGRTILGTTIAASLLLAAAAIKFVMDSIIIRKSREIGTLKALGARDGVVVMIFVYQALFIGIISGGLGLLIATVLMHSLSAYGITLSYSLGAQMKIRFIMTPAAAVTAMALPVAISLLASVLPCRSVARLSPVEAIRRGELQGASEKRRGLRARIDSITPKFRKSLSPLSLAIEEMKDHLPIYSAVVLVICAALAVFALQASYQENLKETVTHTLKDTLCSDGMILGPGSTPRFMVGGAPQIVNARALAQKISADTGYTTVVRSNHQSVIVLGTTENPRYDGGSVWGVDATNDETVFNLRKSLIKGDYFDPNKNYSQNIIGEESQFIPGVRVSGVSTTIVGERLQEPYPVIIGKTSTDANGLDIGSQFSILMVGSTKGSGIVSAPVKVIGIYDTSFTLADSLMYFLPMEAVNQMMGYDADDGNAIVVKAPEGTDYRDIYAALRKSAPEYEAFSWHEGVTYIVGPAFDAMVLIIYTAIAITLILAAVIIKYAMDSTVDRKTREIGTLKAVGARDRIIIKMFIYQGVVIGVLSGAMAVLIAMILSYVAVNIVHMTTKLPMGMIMQVGFTITWAVLGITLFTPLLTSIVAASIPANRAASLSPVEALRKGELNL
ncbi:MAG: FtsX-like permease family protein [Candidatus Thermoplasmatota archaeon]|nr:FtsX-like permease family protein [Candidatus Thermoplasmatota archaeon]